MKTNYRIRMLSMVMASMTLLTTSPIAAESPTLTGRWGETVMPEQLVQSHESRQIRALAVVAFSTRCPHARRMVPLLNELQKKFGSDGIQFVALFPNGADNIRSIAEYAVETDIAFPVYQDDREHPWYKQLGMNTTPQVVLLDTRAGLGTSGAVYRGQINGQWFGGGTSKTTRRYLRDAIESLLQDQLPPLSETAASGCPILPDSAVNLSAHAGVTYYREIAPLVQTKCKTCHRSGEPGGELFSSFESYEDVASVSRVMLDRMVNRLMPPWHASTDPENGLGGFRNDMRLGEKQIQLFQAWVEAGCPAGDPEDGPAKAVAVNATGWKIGKPDFVFQMPEAYVVPKFRLDEYQYYRVKANFTEDRYIKAIEIMPGNPAIVHHIGAIIGPASLESPTATQAMLKLYGLTGDNVKKLGDYVAGDPFNARIYPEGFGLKLPASHDIFFEVHYTPTGREEKPDISKMGIVWADRKPEHVIQTRIFNRKDVRIRPHQMHYERTNHYMFPTDVLIYAVGPHMHFRGKDYSLYKIENPKTDRERKTLVLRVSAYDFNWQRTYEFVNPIRLKAGDVLFAVAHFDNSQYNPNNPDPEAAVRFGLKSEQEMLNLRVKYEAADFGALASETK